MDVTARGLLRKEFARQRELVEELGCDTSNLHHPHNPDSAGYALAFGRVSDSLGDFRARTDARILAEGRRASIATVQYVLACYRSRDPNFSLQPVREGITATDVAAAEAVQEAVLHAAEEVADSLALAEPDEASAETPPPSTPGAGGDGEDASPRGPPAAGMEGAPVAGTEDLPAVGTRDGPAAGTEDSPTAGGNAAAGTKDTPAASGSAAVTRTEDTPAASGSVAAADTGDDPAPEPAAPGA